MATDAVNISEDAEMAEYDGDKVVTMMDVLQEQQDFEEDANAVLGASDDKNCTYAKGYIKRQAIYACLTCCPDVKSDPTKRAGVCLACSLNCHENHELVELYTKRNFRCDCGNPKFNSHPCQFTPNKTDLNNDNIYNQNFSGLYCICQRPYPDPESTFEDEMIQCIICEDWLHASHLDAVVPVNEQYSEMVCKACMERNEFLHDYSQFAVNVESVDVDIFTVNGSISDDSHCNGDVAKDSVSNGIVESNLEIEAVANGADVDMLVDKAKNGAKSDEDIKNAEDNSTEEKPKDSTNNSAEQIDSDANNQPEQILESTNKTDEEPKANPDAVEQKESENKEVNSDVTEDEQNMENDKVENSDDTQEQKEDQSTNDTKADSDKTDSNKTEDQLMEDIRALTSDNPEKEAKSSTVEDTAEESKTDSSVNKDDSENTEESPIEQNKPESKDANPIPESSNIEVPDTSQDTSKKEDDAKTDAVMDAIDALLETTTEAKDVESTDNEKSSDQAESADKKAEDNAETQKPEDVNMSESENKQDVSEKLEIEKSDVEMDKNNQNNENKNDEAPVTSEAKESNDIETDTSKIESAADDKLQSESPTETVLNGDNDALIETDNKTKPNDDDTSKIEPSSDENKADIATEATNENKRKLSTEVMDQNSPKKPKLDSKCVKPKNIKRVHKGATFWPSNFRQKLCTCGECISMYKDLSVLFLIDSDDTVLAYESLGKENVDAGASQYEKGLQALSSLDRIQQINALTEYNRMRDKLLDFLKSFKDRKEIVKEEDIKTFFAGMKPKRESDGVYFCR